jgi:hypothetical protein
MAVPTLSINTPPALIRQRILDYDRERDLMPLIRAHTNRTHLAVICNGNSTVSFDLQQIQQSLQSSTLLQGKTPVIINVRHYEFHHDESATQSLSRLALLKQRVQQYALSPAILTMISNEIDTGQQLAQLLKQLAVCISFVLSVGGSRVRAVAGDTLLSSYMTNVLLMPQAEWDAMSTRTINQHVCLCHLVSIYMSLEEQLNGSPLESVCAEYRVPLPHELCAHLKLLAHQLQCDLLIPLLRDLMVAQLCTTQWPAKSSLKEYLIAFADEDLEAMTWFDSYFPDLAQLAHTMAVYEFLQQQQTGAVPLTADAVELNSW